MIVSYCLNPNCSQPKNHPNLKQCKGCGSSLILHQRYRSIKKIGKGGFGATFLGIDLTLPGNPFCVIKQLRPSSNDPESFQMALDLFEREAKTLGKIDHPQIPRLLDYFEYHQQFYLIQSLVKGKNLQQEVRENGILSEVGAKRFLAEMLPVLRYIHSIKIIHRDIKPANIIRREQDGQLVLIDFGAVKDQVNTQLAKTYGQTALTQFAVGTVGFAPAEQLAMRPVYASDIYALGATCLFLMTGKSPKDFLCDELTGELLWEQEITVSPSFVKVLRKMLEVDVRHRYKLVDEIVADLDIVPYEQELKHSLLTNATPAPQTDNANDDNNTGKSYTSATTRLAQAIRARKERKGKVKLSPQAATPNTLLSAYARGRRDFSKQSFNKFNLVKANLPNINLRNSKLIQANFEEANLEGGNFYSADLKKARFHKANLKQAYFFKAELQFTNFRGANLEEANLEGANLTQANFCGANLTNAQVEPEQLEQAQTNWATIFPNGKRRLW